MKKRSPCTPIFQKELNEGLSFEFHQDAILDGKLLSANTRSSNQVLHPSFFSRLTKTCTSLERYFQVDSFHETSKDKQSNSPFPSGLLGIHVEEERNYPLVLILDCRNPEQYRIEIIPSEIYRAKREEYGHAFYHYFGLIPKLPGLNINIFREFFNNNIGDQIIQLCLNNDGPSNFKSKVRSLLIPQFFDKRENLTEGQEQKLYPINLTKENLLEAHPQELNTISEQIKEASTQLKGQTPWQVLTRLTHLKSKLTEAYEEVAQADNPSQPVDKLTQSFTNKMIISSLLELPTTPLFPQHPDVYMEFLAKSKDEIYQPLTHTAWSECSEDEESQELACLDLYGPSGQVVRCHGPKSILCFIQFILNSAKGEPISQLLQKLYIPNALQLENVLKTYSNQKEAIEKVLLVTQEEITSILKENVSSSQSSQD